MSERLYRRVFQLAAVCNVVWGTVVVLYPNLLFERFGIEPINVTAVTMVALVLFVAVFAPTLLAGAFNPVTTNLSVLGLALIAIRLHPSDHDEHAG